jgi:dGTPase
MRLNEDLTEAIALGHDLGHTPFGHGGETALKEIYSPGFSHNEQSLRVVDFLENKGRGLNLTFEVRDGILKHSKGYGKIIPEDPGEIACTVEGQIVRIADIMAYLNHDLDDAIRSGVISSNEIPEKCSSRLGRTHSERATTMIKDLVFSTKVSDGKLCLQMSDATYDAMTKLREFLYDNVYRSNDVHNEFVKAKKILSELYTYFIKDEKTFHKELTNMEMAAIYRKKHLGEETYERIVCDFIASITDRYALDLYSKIFFPSPLV